MKLRVGVTIGYPWVILHCLPPRKGCAKSGKAGFSMDILAFAVHRLQGILNEPIDVDLLDVESDPESDMSRLQALSASIIDMTPDTTLFPESFRNGWISPGFAHTQQRFVVHLLPKGTENIFTGFGLSCLTPWIVSLIAVALLASIAQSFLRWNLKRVLSGFVENVFDILFFKNRRCFQESVGIQFLITIWSFLALYYGQKLFKSAVVQNMTPKQQIKPPFTKISELADLIEDGKYGLVYSKGSEFRVLLNTPGSQNWPYWGKLIRAVRSVTGNSYLHINYAESSRKLAEEPGTVKIASVISSSYIVDTDPTDQLIAVDDEMMKMYKYSFVVRKSLNFTSFMERIVLELVEFGFVKRLEKMYNLGSKSSIVSHYSFIGHRVSWSQIKSSFLSMVLLYVSCTVILISEIFVRRKLKKPIF